MDIIELNEYFEKHISDFHRFIPSVNEIIVRCPYCGDSIKHQNKGHFYIGESNDVFMYQCKRSECNAAGVLSKRTLEDLGIFDLELFSKISSLKSNSIYKTNLTLINNQNNINKYINYNYEMFKAFYPHKMEYLKKRFYNIDNIDLNKYRIILSPINFIEAYGIRINEFQKNILNDLEQFGIGFLNLNGSNIVFRFLDGYQYRYFKLRLNKDVDIYGIQNQINLVDIDKLHINICEGGIDLINIKNRIKPNVENELFIAANGSEYVSKIEYITKLIGIINVHINIYRDQDMSVNKILNQFRYSIFKDSINIFSNSLAKDYSYDDLFIVKDY